MSRKPSSWKKRAFANVAERDGAVCRECKCPQRFSYIEAGGNETNEGYRFSWTYRRSWLELDHILPLSEGGDNEHGNLQLLCHDCHKRKTSAERSARLKRLFADHKQTVAA